MQLPFIKKFSVMENVPLNEEIPLKSIIKDVLQSERNAAICRQQKAFCLGVSST